MGDSTQNGVNQMKRPYLFAVVLGALALAALACLDLAASPVDDTITAAAQIQSLQDVSVTIHAGSAQGSGVIKTRNGINYVWTAGHVVADLRSTRQVIDKGVTKTVVEFKDAQVVKELVEDGRSVGMLKMDAEIIRYSNADNGEDLALLRVRKKNFVVASVRFYLEDKIPALGTRLLHCGSLLGQVGSNSLTSGIMSQNGRVLNGKVYDQSTVTAFPGSSGGGVYRESDGLYVGMLTRGAGETFNLMVPVRRMRTWAKTAGVEWALDDKVPVPDQATLKKMPIEDVGSKFEAPEKAPGPMPPAERFLIYRP